MATINENGLYTVVVVTGTSANFIYRGISDVRFEGPVSKIIKDTEGEQHIVATTLPVIVVPDCWREPLPDPVD